MPIEIQDYRELSKKAQQKAIQKYTAKDRVRGFDFAEAPLMRICLFRLADNEYRLLWSFHHILLDGWSLPVLIEELLQTYESLINAQPVLVAEEDRYENYIRYINRRNKQEEKQYWFNYLNPLTESSKLPFVRTAAEQTKGNGQFEIETIQLGKAVTASLTAYTQRNRITLNTLVQGVWAYLLHHYTGRADVVYGVTVSGRPEDLAGVERAVGMYINTLPLFTQIESAQEVSVWLQQLQADQLRSREFQYSALNEIQRQSSVSGELFDSILVFENYPVDEVLLAQSWKLQLSGADVKEQTNYPLSITVMAGEEINIRFEYNTALLSSADVRRMTGHFETTLFHIITQKAPKLENIDILTAEEKQWLIEDLNAHQFTYPADQTIVSLFAEQMLKSPSAIAVVFENEQLTYAQLDELSNKLAHKLIGFSIKRGTLIPLFIERSPEMIVGILGILKAGAAYVPIHPDYPAERTAFILSDIAAPLILSSRVSSVFLPETGLPVVLLDNKLLSAGSSKEPVLEYYPSDLAYVIYTSGSTGQPKGVLVEHRSVVNLICYQASKLVSIRLISSPVLEL